MQKLDLALCGVFLPAVLLVLSAVYTVALRGRPFRGMRRLLEGLKDCGAGGQPAGKTVMLALAGTLGVGNIVGVCDAIARGGAGVLFWMWVSAGAAMIVKYAEVVLSMRRRICKKDGVRGGPMYYLPRGAAGAFCVLLTVCAFSVGSALQTAACADASDFLPFPAGAATAILLACATAVCIFSKKRKLFDLAVKIVPAMTALFSLLCLTVIAAHARRFPEVLGQIFREAFSWRAAVGGSGAGMLTALRFGLIRGLVSNEAGCGTAPIAHASSGVRNGAPQGALGVIEVAVDTLLLCSLTGFALLLSGVPTGGAGPIAAFTSALQSVFGGAAPVFLYLSLMIFAFATLVCWSFYLESAASYLFRGAAPAAILKGLFCLVAAAGPFIPREVLWYTADLSVALMTALNCVALFRFRGEAKEETERYFASAP